MDIKITDVFNIDIKNPKKRFNKDYIVLEIDNESIDDYLTTLNQYNGVYIYKLKKDGKLANIFNKIGLNINNYIELGNYIIYDINNIKILLVNKKNTQVTNRYSLLHTAGQLYIWKPISTNPNYINMGLICTSNPNEIPEDYIGLIPHNHIKIFQNSYSDLLQNDNNLIQNDYNLLGSSKDNKKKLITFNILNENDNESVDSYDSYDSKDSYDSYETSSKIRKIENFDGNTEGEQVLDNDENKNWNQYKSRSLVLVESNNPWYINKNDTIPIKYIKNDDYFNRGYHKYSEGSSYDSNIELDGASPTMGYGYSFADRRKVQKPEKIENFSDDSDNVDNTNYIIIILFIVIALLFLYNVYYKKKNTIKY